MNHLKKLLLLIVRTKYNVHKNGRKRRNINNWSNKKYDVSLQNYKRRTMLLQVNKPKCAYYNQYLPFAFEKAVGWLRTS